MLPNAGFIRHVGQAEPAWFDKQRPQGYNKYQLILRQ